MAIKRTHFLKHEDYVLAACGSARRTEKDQQGFTANPTFVTCTRCRQTMAFIEAVGHVDPAPTHTPVKEEVFPVGGNESQLVESPVSAVEEDTYSIEWRVFNKPMRLNGLDKLEFSELLTMLLERNYSVQVHKELKEW